MIRDRLPRLLLVLAVTAGCHATDAAHYAGYPHRLAPADPASLAARRTEADAARREGWDVRVDADGFVDVVSRRGAAFGDPANQLGPLDDAAFARLRAWIGAHPAMFGLGGEQELEVRSDHPGGPWGALCQRSGGRRAACIYISWSAPFYADFSTTPERLTISGHHWPDLPAIPGELDDATIASRAIEPWSPWKFYQRVIAKDFRQITGMTEKHDREGTHYKEIEIYRAPRRVRDARGVSLRMVATVTQLATTTTAFHEWYLDAVTGEQLAPGDVHP